MAESQNKEEQFILPEEGEEIRLKELTYSILQQIWQASREFNIFRTKKGVVLIGGEKNSGISSYRYSEKGDPVVVDAHSHPSNKNNFSLLDYLSAKGKEVSDIVVLYQNGALAFHIDKSKRGDSEITQKILEFYISENQKTRKYKVNQKSSPYHERLSHVVDEFSMNNLDKSNEIERDLTDFTANQPGISVKRYDLSDPNSQDTQDFLDLYNK